MRKRKKMNVMILPVGTSCNLACKYCYHSDEVNKKISVMPDGILRKIIRESAELANEIDFIWHGGEPLLAGKSFYEKAVSFQNETRFSGKIKNIIQTNATLIDDDWADFLTRNDFLVGVSIDGPRILHDACRVNKRECGTFIGVVDGLKKIQERKKNVGCITLITTRNVNYPEEVFRIMRELKIPNMALHFCASTFSRNSDDFIPTQKSVLRFLKKLFRLWTDADDPSFRIRNFVNVIRANNGAKALDCAHQSDACKFFVAIDAVGNVFPCHRFSHDLTKRIGNITTSNLSEILESSKGIYASMSELPANCKKCQHLAACGNGCAYERFVARGSFNSRHPNCWTNKKITSHIKRWEKIESNK